MELTIIFWRANIAYYGILFAFAKINMWGLNGSAQANSESK